jgi:hypothetical protein
VSGEEVAPSASFIVCADDQKAASILTGHLVLIAEEGARDDEKQDFRRRHEAAQQPASLPCHSHHLLCEKKTVRRPGLSVQQRHAPRRPGHSKVSTESGFSGRAEVVRTDVVRWRLCRKNSHT